MSELKTLKDFEGKITSAEMHKFYNELKAEAIKWVKYWRSLDENKCIRCGDYTDTDFMHFFNLSEEDLK